MIGDIFMKKLLAMCMSILVIGTAFVGCGTSEDTDTSSDNTSINTREPEGVATNTTTSTESATEATTTESVDSDSDDIAMDTETGTVTADVDEYAVGSTGLEFKTDQSAPLGEQIGEEVDLTDELKSQLGQLERSDEYTMDIHSYTFGGSYTIEVPMIATAKGDDTYVSTNFMGMDMEILTLDGQNYFINSESKIYCPASAEDASATGEASNNVNTITGLQDDAKSACKVIVNGEDMVRIACTTDELGCYAYLSDDKLRYIASVYEEKVGTLMVIDTISQECNEQLLSIPSDYREVTIEEYMGSAYGDVFDSLLGEEAEFPFDYDPNVSDSLNFG